MVTLFFKNHSRDLDYIHSFLACRKAGPKNRALESGALVAGHPRHDWTSKFQSYTRHRRADNWCTEASNMESWTHLTDLDGRFHIFFPSSSAQHGLTTGMQDDLNLDLHLV